MINFIKPLIPKENAVMSLSMGIDSLAAAHFLLTKTRIKFSAFHFNHNLRKQNDEMEENARHFCGVYGIPLKVGKAKGKLKSESECRSARLNSFCSLYPNSNLITAHHLDDCVESYLLNCLRGNPDYLPIPLKTNLDDGGAIWHPFLLTEKGDFAELITNNKLLKHWLVEDETNYDKDVAVRNWMRSDLLPLIHAKKCFNLKKIVSKKIRDKINKEINK